MALYLLYEVFLFIITSITDKNILTKPLTLFLSVLPREKGGMKTWRLLWWRKIFKKEMGFYRFWPVVSQAANFSLVCISLGVVPSPRIRT